MIKANKFSSCLPMKLIFIAVLVSIITFNYSCSSILAPKQLHATGNYKCEPGYLIEGSAVCNLQITNNDGFDWNDVILTINDKYIYATKIPLIHSKETFYANLSNFILDDGTRFDINTIKPLNFTLKTKEGIYYGFWD